jgi:hypothetical protein
MVNLRYLVVRVNCIVPTWISHADACAVSHDVMIFQYFDRPVSVSSYDPNGPVVNDLKAVSAGLAYDELWLGYAEHAPLGFGQM